MENLGVGPHADISSGLVHRSGDSIEACTLQGTRTGSNYDGAERNLACFFYGSRLALGEHVTQGIARVHRRSAHGPRSSSSENADSEIEAYGITRLTPAIDPLIPRYSAELRILRTKPPDNPAAISLRLHCRNDSRTCDL